MTHRRQPSAWSSSSATSWDSHKQHSTPSEASTPATTPFSSPQKRSEQQDCESSHHERPEQPHLLQARQLSYGDKDSIKPSRRSSRSDNSSRSASPALSSTPPSAFAMEHVHQAAASASASASGSRADSPASRRPSCRREWFGSGRSSPSEQDIEALSQRLKSLETQEPLLRDEGNDRFVLFPIKYPMVSSYTLPPFLNFINFT